MGKGAGKGAGKGGEGEQKPAVEPPTVARAAPSFKAKSTSPARLPFAAEVDQAWEACGLGKAQAAVGAALWLQRKEDVRTVALVCVFYALQIGRWRASDERIAQVDAALLGLGDELWIALICAFSFIGATLTHNCIHVAMFRRVRGDTLNKLWNIVLTNTYGWPVSTLIPGHNLSHHKHTQGPKDVMRTTKMRYNWNLLNLLTFVVQIIVDINKYDAAYFEDQKKQGRPIYKQLLLECFFFWPLQAALLLLNWRRYLLLVLGPQMLGKWGIITINLLQHDGCIQPEDPVCTPNDTCLPRPRLRPRIRTTPAAAVAAAPCLRLGSICRRAASTTSPGTSRARRSITSRATTDTTRSITYTLVRKSLPCVLNTRG